MKTIRAVRLLWIGIATLILLFAATYAVTSSAKCDRCKSSPCSYYSPQGGNDPGTCGCKKGDNKNCYCFDNEDNKLSQVQAACSATQ